MNATARRVAVLGGIRIPFARQNGPYARASNQDMLTATLDALVDALRARGRGPRRGRRRRRAQAQPRLQPHARVRARLQARARDARLRRPAGVRHRPGGDDPRRQQDRARADRLRHRRRRRHHLRRADRDQRGPARGAARAQPHQVERRAAARRSTKLRPQQLVPEIPRNAEPRTGLSMGEHAAIMATRVGDRARGAGRAGRRQPPPPRRRLRHRLDGRSRHAVPGARARPEPARRTRASRSWPS